MSASVEKFDLGNAKEIFITCLKDEDDILLDEYLSGYKELYKFFQLMGSVFSFVSSDVKSKVEILEEFRKKENSENFLTCKTMLNYEKNEGLFKKKDYVSGSRTLLRLHRGLDFIREFLDKVGKINPDDKTCAECQSAYNATLAHFHPWLVRKGALLAMHALPTRDVLLTKVCVDVNRAIELLPSALETISEVYDRVDKLYTSFDLHELP